MMAAAIESRVPESFTSREELAHALSHGLGALLSVVGLVVMAFRASGETAKPWALFAASVFGVSLIVLYSSSTLYHGARSPGRKRLFQLFDHLAIYYLIAGTYPPFTIVALGGSQGWTFFGILWAIAIGGSVFEVLTGGRRKKIALAAYLAMGWIAVFFAKDLSAILPSAAMWLIVGGGVLYTLGAVFYAWKRLPYNHVLWHLFVLAGSATHFFCILDYVLIDATH